MRTWESDVRAAEDSETLYDLGLRMAAEIERLTEEADGKDLWANRAVANREEAERLRVIVDRLPKDAEGNPVAPGDELVSTHFGVPQRSREVVEVNSNGWRFENSGWYKQGDPVRLCYRSMEAAKRARKA